MKTREKILDLLEARKGEYLSGADLASDLSITRAAVWKAVTRLREDGYPINAVPNKGYRFAEDTDFLTEQGIWKYLDPCCGMLDIHVLPEAGSTNELLRKKAEAGSPEGTVLIAGMQTDGKGRQGRRFYSPANTGIYMSLLLRPVDPASSQAVRLTAAAAVAGCEAIGSVSGRAAQIKWVNDIFLDRKKVCGILTEGPMGVGSSSMGSVIVGIGINAYPPEGGFPKEIREIAGAVFSEPQNDGKNRLAAGFLNRFMGYYLHPEESDYAEKYKAHSMVIGNEISVLSGNSVRKASTLDIDADCCLLVRYENGETARLAPGEIRIK